MIHNGSCLCGDVTFKVDAELEHPVACHCSQCRKQSGHVWAVASAPRDKVTLDGALSWYAASEMGERGFCRRCGSFLFWRGHDDKTIEVALGALEAPTGVTLQAHIFVADRGDYYEIADGLTQYPGEAP